MGRVSLVAGVGWWFILSGMLWAGDADLTITKAASPDPVVLDQSAIYQISVTNHGPDPANNVVIVDHLPDGAVFVSADQGGVYDMGTHTVTWTSPLLGVDATLDVQLEITAALPQSNAEVEVFFNGLDFNTSEPTLFQLQAASSTINQLNALTGAVLPQGLAHHGEGYALTDPGDLTLLDAGSPIFDGRILMIETGTPTVLSSGGLLVNPRAVVSGPDGMLYVADPDGLRDDGMGGALPDQTGRIIRVDPSDGSQTVLAEGNHLVSPRDLVLDEQARLLVADGSGGLIRIDRDTGDQTLLASGGLFADLRAVGLFPDGPIYALDGTNGLLSVDVQDYMATVLTPIGGGDPQLLDPFDLQVGLNGTLFASDLGPDPVGAIHEIDSGSGSITNSWLGAAVTGFSQPGGMDLAYLYTNSVTVTSDDVDTNPGDNTFSLVSGVTYDPGPTTVTINVSETVTISDTSAVVPALQITIQETVGVADTQTTMPATAINVTESATVTDSAIVLPAIQINITEAVMVSDSDTVTPPPMITVTESVTVGDTVTVTPALQINVTEIVSLTDTGNPVPALRIAVQEPITALDTTQTQASSSPPVIERIRLFNDPDLFSDEDNLTRASVTQLHVTFNEPMADPPGDSEPGDVTNPIHYVIVSGGADLVVETGNCADGVAVGDLQIPLSNVAFLQEQRSAVLSPDLNTALPQGNYRLLICGDTGLVDLEGLMLDGDGDQQPGGDYSVDFTVSVTNRLVNPNLDEDVSGWTLLPDDPPAAVISEADSDGSLTSGSALMTDSGDGSGGSMMQCLDVTPATWYRLGGRVQLQRELPGDPGLIARLVLFPVAGCADAAVSEKVIPLELGIGGGEWVHFEVTLPIPDGVASATITLGFAEGTMGTGQIWWDNLILAEDPEMIFADDFESGDLSRWQ